MDKNKTYFYRNQHNSNAQAPYSHVHVVFQVETNCTEQVWTLQVDSLSACSYNRRSLTAKNFPLRCRKSRVSDGGDGRDLQVESS